MEYPRTHPSISCAGLQLTPLWHCFGNANSSIDLPTIQHLLDESGTNVLPINTHALDRRSGRDGLLLGFGRVRYDDLAACRDLARMVPVLNINHQLSADAAVAKTTLAVTMTGFTAIKLEVLHADLATSNNREVITAVGRLRAWNRDLKLMPLVQCHYGDAEELVAFGSPLLRVMGSPIGSGGGIADPEEFARICALPVPVILDGGVGSPSHVKTAFALGASGYLLNSVLFRNGMLPEVVMRNFVRTLGNHVAPAV